MFSFVLTFIDETNGRNQNEILNKILNIFLKIMLSVGNINKKMT